MNRFEGSSRLERSQCTGKTATRSKKNNAEIVRKRGRREGRTYRRSRSRWRIVKSESISEENPNSLTERR